MSRISTRMKAVMPDSCSNVASSKQHTPGVEGVSEHLRQKKILFLLHRGMHHLSSKLQSTCWMLTAASPLLMVQVLLRQPDP